MKESVKIATLEMENVKRVKAVQLSVEGNALTVIGGRNGQGKTSILDGIVWALGGDKHRPSNPIREGEEEAYIKLTLSNGITVERKGKNGSLKVTSPTGKGGQAILNEFLNELAIDLPQFMAANDGKKAEMLLRAYPELAGRLQKATEKVKALYDERHRLGIEADRKAKHAAELPYDETVPDELLTGADMAREMQAALQRNAANQATRDSAARLAERIRSAAVSITADKDRIEMIEAQLEGMRKTLATREEEFVLLQAQHRTASLSAQELRDEDTSAIQQRLEEIDAVNGKIRRNMDKRHAEAQAESLKTDYNALTLRVEEARAERLQLLAEVKLPLPELSITEEGALTYRGQEWDGMSGSEQLRVATAICAAMKPQCGFVLVDKLEQMDLQTLREFGSWLESQNLQAIGTRVSTGSECSIIIEDGQALDVPAEVRAAVAEPKKKFKF